MFPPGVLEHITSNDALKLVIVYNTKIEGRTFEEDYLHEEADTLIPDQVLVSIAEHGWKGI